MLLAIYSFMLRTKEILCIAFRNTPVADGIIATI
jgi:hypothetical protein